MSFTEEELNQFRKDAGNDFYVPENHIICQQIANSPMWMRMIHMWKAKRDAEDAIELFDMKMQIQNLKR